MRSHRELVAWQVANRSAVAIHRYFDQAWKPQRAAVIEQVRRSSLSVPLNLAEGYAQGRGPRCKFHLRVAFGSAVETYALLEFIIELGGNVSELMPMAAKTQSIALQLLRKTKP
jgi:four helix bundle protein